jgi:hypothetical protein
MANDMYAEDSSDDTPVSANNFLNPNTSSSDPYANLNSYSGPVTVIDQQVNGDGTVTNFMSDGSSKTTTITNGAQNVQTDPSSAISNFTKSASDLFSGKTAGGAGQLAGIAGLYALLNSLGGGLGNGSQGVYKGYTGGIPHFTASRAQYGVPQQQIGTFGATTGDKGLPNVTSQQFADYVKNPAINDAQIANAMNRYGINTGQAATALGAPQSVVQNRYNQVMGPNAQLGSYRPGQGGITYFTPMQYAINQPAAATPTPEPTPTPVVDSTVKVAGGGMMSGGISSLGSYSDGGRMLRGPGDGVSDSIPAVIGGHQKAALADGEFVIPARIVSEIGNGSSDAGARKLYKMMDRIQNARKKTTKNVAADTKAEKYLPI